MIDALNCANQPSSKSFSNLQMFEYDGFMDESLTRCSRKRLTCFLLRREQKSHIIDLKACSTAPHALIIEYLVRYGTILLVAPRLSINVFTCDSSFEQSSRSLWASTLFIVQTKQHFGGFFDSCANRHDTHGFLGNDISIVLITQQQSSAPFGICG